MYPFLYPFFVPLVNNGALWLIVVMMIVICGCEV